MRLREYGTGPITFNRSAVAIFRKTIPDVNMPLEILGVGHFTKKLTFFTE